MRLNLKPMIVALAAAALLCGGSALASPSPSADSSAYWSDRASALLTEIQRLGLQCHQQTNEALNQK